MIDLIKELSVILKDLPDAAMWVFAGVLAYKLLITGSIVGALVKVSTYGLKVLHDHVNKPKEHVYSLDNEFILEDGTYTRFKTLIEEMQSRTDYTSYIHSHDVDYLIDAWREKKERDGKK